MLEAVICLYILCLLTYLTQMTSSIMMTWSESRLANGGPCRKMVVDENVEIVTLSRKIDLVCSTGNDSWSQDDMDSLHIPCPPPHHFIEFCDANIGHQLTCKIKLQVMRYCYEKYSLIYPAKVCRNCSCDAPCEDVSAFMIHRGFLEYLSTTSSTVTPVSADSRGIAVTENLTDIVLPSINTTSNDSNGADISVTTLETKTKLSDSHELVLQFPIIGAVIFIIEAIVLIIIFRYRRKHSRRHNISRSLQEEDAATELYRVSSTGSIILQSIEPTLEPNKVPTVYNIQMDNPVFKSSNSLEAESDRNIFEDYDKWRYMDDSRSVSSL